MFETPKKAPQSDRCFICSNVVQKKEKIIYFDLPAVICSCLDVNVSSYSASSEFSLQSFAKKTTRLVQKFIHLGGLTHESKGLYKDRELTRTKRLGSIENDHDNGETAADACREKPRNVFTIPDRYHITYASSDAAARDFPKPVVRLTKTSFLSSTIFPIPDFSLCVRSRRQQRTLKNRNKQNGSKSANHS